VSETVGRANRIAEAARTAVMAGIRVRDFICGGEELYRGEMA
jgi:hypothetical protein